MSVAHPDEATLLRSVVGDLTERRQAAINRHVEGCPACRSERERTKSLHERLSSAGDSIAFAPGDPFEARPNAGALSAPSTAATAAMARALATLEAEKESLRAAIEADPAQAAAALDLSDATCRLAAAHVLERAVESDPSEDIGRFAISMMRGPVGRSGDAEAVLPAAQLEAVVRLVVGNWRLFCGRPNEATGELAAAWAALARFDVPEHLVAWVEVGESLRRSYDGRPAEARLLAERALATFERYGLARGVLRARHARAVALYTACRFRESHREFRLVLRSNCATRLDRARAVSGAGFCLGARGRFHDAAKEYSRVRRRLKGEGAQVEQYLLQGEMKVVLGTAGRWHSRGDRVAAFALPEAFGAFRARDVAKTGLDTAEAMRNEVVDRVARAPFGGFTLLQLLQLSNPRVAANPSFYVELAQSVASATRSWSTRGPLLGLALVPSELILAEARLLESNASNFWGLAPEAAQLAREARTAFSAVGEKCSFLIALADFFEASAITFVGDGRPGWRPLRASRKAFDDFGQENWSGRAVAATGLVLTRVSHDASAVRCFDEALRRLDSDRDWAAVTATLLNRGGALDRLGQFDAAKATLARALMLARRHGLRTIVLTIRTCLANVERSQGKLIRALRSFEMIAQDAASLGAEEHALGARLRASLCLVRLGRLSDARAHLDAVRRSPFATSLSSEPDIRAFFESDSTVEDTLIVRLAKRLESCVARLRA